MTDEIIDQLHKNLYDYFFLCIDGIDNGYDTFLEIPKYNYNQYKTSLNN